MLEDLERHLEGRARDLDVRRPAASWISSANTIALRGGGVKRAGSRSA
jgi:hypothetical protein